MASTAFQTILTSLLVGLMMLGNAAAWIHHGTCNDVQCRVSSVEEKSHCSSNHCCHSHRAKSVDDAISLNAGESGKHDSSHCASCHTATTGGMAASLASVIVPESVDAIDSASLPAVLKLPLVAREQLHLRGPPALLA